MAIDEAIRDLQARVDGEFNIKGEDDCADMKLGIEALKLVKLHRRSDFCYEDTLLLGETECLTPCR